MSYETMIQPVAEYPNTFDGDASLGIATKDLNKIKESVDVFCQKQEKKMNQLWAAVSQKVHQSSDGLHGQEHHRARHVKRHMDWVQHKLVYGKAASPLSNSEREGLKSFVKSGVLIKSLSSTDEAGGYLMPHPVQVQIEQALCLSGAIRGLSRVTSISSDSLDVMRDGDTGDVGWVSEKGSRDETRAPSVQSKRIFTHEIYAKPMISQKLLDDAAVNIEEWVVDTIAANMMRLENASFVHGDGVGKPKGFLSYPRALVGQDNGEKIGYLKTGKDSGFLSIDVLYDVLDAMKSDYREGAVWYMSRSALTQIRRLKTVDGLSIWQPSLREDHPDTLLGYPIVLSDDMPHLEDGKPSLIVFANFHRGYQIVDRHDMRLLRDPYSSKPFVEFYATKRVGGDVIDCDAFKILALEE